MTDKINLRAVKMNKDDPAFLPGCKLAETNIDNSDAVVNGGFAWYGWAIRAAFWAGVQWQREHEQKELEEARRVIGEIVGYLDPHPPAQPMQQEALDIAENYLMRGRDESDNATMLNVVEQNPPPPEWFNEAFAGRVCTCHERDGSFVCEYCRAQGMKGHMQ